MTPQPAPLPPVLRRMLAIVAILALAIAGITLTATENDTVPTVFTLPGATAEPTGPPGPTGPGPGSGGGSQYQPPDMGGIDGGYSGGNYPAPPQGNGIDINNPGAAPEYGQAPQYPQQHPYPSRQPPVHGTQPPNYDLPPQQAPTQQAPQQEPQQSAQQQEPQQRPDNNQDTQRVNQRQQECQDAAAMLGNTLVGISGGGGSSPVWIEPGLDPAPVPQPPCSQCEPQTSQKQEPSNDDLQKQIDDLKRQNVDQQRQIDDAKKCDAGEWMTVISGGISSLGLLGIGILSAPTGIGIAAAGFGAVGTAGSLISVARCISNG